MSVMNKYKGIPVFPSVVDGCEPDGFDHDAFRTAAEEAISHVERWGVSVRKLTHDKEGVLAHTLSGAKVRVRYPG